jgi:hypothetical protein
MRRAMGDRLSSDRNPTFTGDILIGEMMAEGISRAFFGMCTSIAELAEAEVGVANKLRKKVKDMIELRNEVAHGDWLIAWEGDDRQTVVRLSKMEPLHGTFSVQDITSDWLDNESFQLKKLRSLVAEFGDICLGGILSRTVWPQTPEYPDPIRIRDVFDIDGGNVVRNGPRADEFTPNYP